MYDALVADKAVVNDNGVSVRCGSVIYFLECSHRDAERIVDKIDRQISVEGPRSNMPIEPTEGSRLIYCQLEQAETTISLLGFASEKRRALYRALRNIQGVGKKTALLVLDCGEVVDTLRAVVGSDTAYFRGVPGLGQSRIKTVIEDLAARYKDILPEALPIPTSWWVDARDMLMQEGQGDYEAEKIIRQSLEQASVLPKSDVELLTLVQSRDTE